MIIKPIALTGFLCYVLFYVYLFSYISLYILNPDFQATSQLVWWDGGLGNFLKNGIEKIKLKLQAESIRDSQYLWGRNFDKE